VKDGKAGEAPDEIPELYCETALTCPVCGTVVEVIDDWGDILGECPDCGYEFD